MSESLGRNVSIAAGPLEDRAGYPARAEEEAREGRGGSESLPRDHCSPPLCPAPHLFMWATCGGRIQRDFQRHLKTQ